MGTPLAWPDAKKVADHVRSWGIEVGRTWQVVLHFRSNARHSNCFQFGGRPRERNGTRCYGGTKYAGLHQNLGRDDADEAQIEYLVVAFDDKQRSVKLSLRQAEILEQLAKDEELLKQGGGVPDLAVGSCKYALHRMPDRLTAD